MSPSDLAYSAVGIAYASAESADQDQYIGSISVDLSSHIAPYGIVTSDAEKRILLFGSLARLNHVRQELARRRPVVGSSPLLVSST